MEWAVHIGEKIHHWFFQTLHLIPLPGWPTVFATTKPLFKRVFQDFGIPEDRDSDRGTQFTSWVWTSFVGNLGGSISLTSVYHPGEEGSKEHSVPLEFGPVPTMNIKCPKLKLQHLAPQLIQFEWVLGNHQPWEQPSPSTWNAKPLLYISSGWLLLGEWEGVGKHPATSKNKWPRQKRRTLNGTEEKSLTMIWDTETGRVANKDF